MHSNSEVDSSEQRVLEPCSSCHELVEKKHLQPPVCKLHLERKSSVDLREEIREYLQYDPARAISAHVVASLMLFPNKNSPLYFLNYMANSFYLENERSLEGLSFRFMSAISAYRGDYHSVSAIPYNRVLGKSIDVEEIEFQLRYVYVCPSFPLIYRSNASMTFTFVCAQS